MKKRFETRKQITVYLGAEEYAQIEALANGNVSSYARKVLLQSALPREEKQLDRVPDVPASTAIPTPTRRESVPARPTARELAVSIPGVSAGFARCVCGDLQSKHVRGSGRCQSMTCSCERYVESAR